MFAGMSLESNRKEAVSIDHWHLPADLCGAIEAAGSK
jgi:hypothetical protein